MRIGGSGKAADERVEVVRGRFDADVARRCLGVVKFLVDFRHPGPGGRVHDVARGGVPVDPAPPAVRATTTVRGSAQWRRRRSTSSLVWTPGPNKGGICDERTSRLGSPARPVPTPRGWLVPGNLAQRTDDHPIRAAAGLRRPAQRRNRDPVPAHARPAVRVAHRAQHRAVALPPRQPAAAAVRTRTGRCRNASCSAPTSSPASSRS